MEFHNRKTGQIVHFDHQAESKLFGRWLPAHKVVKEKDNSWTIHTSGWSSVAGNDQELKDSLRKYDPRRNAAEDSMRRAKAKRDMLD